MVLSDKGVRCLINLEGVRRKHYCDKGGFPKIGVGHHITKDETKTGRIRINDLSVEYKKGLSIHLIHALLKQDITHFENIVKDNVPTGLSQDEFDALVVHAFSMGRKPFINSKVVSVLKEDCRKGVPDAIRYPVYLKGSLSKNLVQRRELEVELWRGG